MKNNEEYNLTQEQKENLSKLSPIDIIDEYCEYTLAELEKNIGCPIHISVNRVHTLKEHQDFKISQKISLIKAKLNTIGQFSRGENTHMKPFDYGMKVFLIHLKEAYEKGIFTKEQVNEVKKIIIEYIFDDFVRAAKDGFLIGHNNIYQYEMIFLLYEFTFHSPVFQEKYGFIKGSDIRKTTFSRIEIATMNAYQDHKLNIANIENQFLDSIADFSYSVEEAFNIIFEQKEVYYRIALLNNIYFNLEHFLSEIIKTFDIAKEIKKKQEYLSKTLIKLNMEQHVDYKLIYDEIEKRCKESSLEYLNILKCEKSHKISLITIFEQIINMRNSLHSNGAANKDISEFNIGKIHFSEVKKGKQFSSMAMHQLIILMVIATYTVEKIIEKMSEVKKINNIEVPAHIPDKYLEGREAYIKELRKNKQD